MLKKECCGLSAQRESCIEMKAISIEVEIWIKEREGGRAIEMHIIKLFAR